jgi:hypothetical protein
MSSNKADGTVVVVAIVAGLVLVISGTWGMWKLTRWWNYNMGYESQVTATVCIMVKPEYLTAEGLERCK